MQALTDLIHALSGLGPWGCLGLAIVAAMFVLPPWIHRQRQADHTEAIKDMTPQQLEAYRAAPTPPSTIKHMALVLAVLFVGGLAVGFGGARLLARSNAASCKSDADCLRGERCVSGTCSMSCASVGTTPQSSFDIDDRPPGLPVYSSGWLR